MNTNRVKIEKMVNGGYGLARSQDGQVILLHNSLIGETVQYRILEKRKKLLFGTAEEILAKNSGRITPPCQYYHKCGGCNLQHCTYHEQLRIKDSIIEELLQEIPGAKALLHSIVPSPLQFGYRQRIRLKAGPVHTGFLQFRSKEIVPVRACLLAHPAINEILETMLDSNEFATLQKNAEEVEFLFNPKTTEVTCLFHYQRKPRPTDYNMAEKLVENTEKLERLFFTGMNFSLEGPIEKKEGNPNEKFFSQQIELLGRSSHLELTWEVGSFCQVNLEQNTHLINYVLQKCGDVTEHTILDLFCGMGNFSIPLAYSASSLLGIEGQGAAVRSAKKNSSMAQLTNIVFTKGEIDETVQRLIKEKQQFDIVILDPPRQGVPGLADYLFFLTREKMVYISCDPATLRRDLINLCRSGFQLLEIQPFDMFPQTHHIETVAVLKKVNSSSQPS